MIEWFLALSLPSQNELKTGETFQKSPVFSIWLNSLKEINFPLRRYC